MEFFQPSIPASDCFPVKMKEAIKNSYEAIVQNKFWRTASCKLWKSSNSLVLFFSQSFESIFFSLKSVTLYQAVLANGERKKWSKHACTM